MSPDIAASVKARLLNIARANGEEFERFLYRLGASGVRDRCILKGAALLTLWMRDPYRATRDLDLLAAGSNDAQSMRALVEAICVVPCPEDGLRFDLDSLEVSPIRVEEEYGGQRAVLRAYLGTARIRLQVDFGFGDAVTPPARGRRISDPAGRSPHPWLRAYPRVVTIAEKFEAMVQLGLRNSRMKDFHFVRSGPGTVKLPPESAREYIRTRFAGSERQVSPPGAV